jgi:cytochrome c oxidase subunit 3
VTEKDLRPTGLLVFLLSLTTLLGASIVGYLVVRLRAPVWPPKGIPGLPPTLWLSTLLLLTGSVTIHYAVAGVRRGLTGRLRVGLAVTMGIGVLFLATQVVSGWEVLAAVAGRPGDLFTFTFVMLAALHGVHVLGGLVPLAIVTRHAFEGRYSREDHTAPRLVGVYWHFLDLAWLVMFVLLMV